MPSDEQIRVDLVHTYDGCLPGNLFLVPPTILSYLQKARKGDLFLTVVSSHRPDSTITYGQLDTLSNRLAHYFRNQFGNTAIVGIIPTNDMESVIAIVALMRAGYSILFLSPTDPAERLRQQIGALGANYILRSQATTSATLPEAQEIPSAETLDDPPSTWQEPTICPSDIAFFLATSGSTAASKMVAQTHYNAVVNAAGVVRHHGLKRGERFLGCLPIHHVNGLHFTLFATIAAGAHAILTHTFDPFNYHRWIERFRPSIASVVPSILEVLLETWRRPTIPTEFRYFVSAAAPLTTQTARGILERLGVRILQGYGLTETTNFSTTMPCDLSDDFYRSLMIDCDIPSVGVPLYGNEVEILSPGGNPVARGEIGEICMRGHNVMSGYANNPEATAEAFRDGWFHSQDLGFEYVEMHSKRRFFIITGRIKNIAKVGGQTVSLEEMERGLRAYPGISDAACSALPDRFLGEMIVAAVVASNVNDSEMRAHLRTLFAADLLPTRIVRLAAIPRTPTGKIRRGALIDLISEESSS